MSFYCSLTFETQHIPFLVSKVEIHIIFALFLMLRKPFEKKNCQAANLQKVREPQEKLIRNYIDLDFLENN